MIWKSLCQWQCVDGIMLHAGPGEQCVGGVGGVDTIKLGEIMIILDSSHEHRPR